MIEIRWLSPCLQPGKETTQDNNSATQAFGTKKRGLNAVRWQRDGACLVEGEHALCLEVLQVANELLVGYCADDALRCLLLHNTAYFTT